MRLAFTQPVPFIEERDRSLENAYRENFATIARDGTIIDIVWLPSGYSEPTYAWTETHNAVEMVKTCYRVWKKGYDGIVIGSTQEPGLIEARSIIGIPVVGLSEASAAIAATLGTKFSILLLHQAHAVLVSDRFRRYGLSGRLAGVECAGVSAVEARGLYADPVRLLSTIRELATRAVREDRAEVIIPACSLLSTILTHRRVHEIGGVPVIDPVWAGIKMAEVLVDLKEAYGIGVCRKSIYAAPPDWEKEIPIKP